MSKLEVEILLVEDNPDDLELSLHVLRQEKLANQVAGVRSHSWNERVPPCLERNGR